MKSAAGISGPYPPPVTFASRDVRRHTSDYATRVAIYDVARVRISGRELQLRRTMTIELVPAGYHDECQKGCRRIEVLGKLSSIAAVYCVQIQLIEGSRAVLRLAEDRRATSGRRRGRGGARSHEVLDHRRRPLQRQIATHDGGGAVRVRIEVDEANNGVALVLLVGVPEVVERARGDGGALGEVTEVELGSDDHLDRARAGTNVDVFGLPSGPRRSRPARELGRLAEAAVLEHVSRALRAAVAGVGCGADCSRPWTITTRKARDALARVTLGRRALTRFARRAAVTGARVDVDAGIDAKGLARRAARGVGHAGAIFADGLGGATSAAALGRRDAIASAPFGLAVTGDSCVVAACAGGAGIGRVGLARVAVGGAGAAGLRPRAAPCARASRVAGACVTTGLAWVRNGPPLARAANE